METSNSTCLVSCVYLYHIPWVCVSLIALQLPMDDIPVSVRLRRAIIRNDTLLVKRIVKSNPLYLHNPDFNDKCNTSLHLAATFGHVEIVKVLVDFGHDDCRPNILHTGYDTAPGISVNTDCSTPLHLAAAHNHHACVEFLCSKFPQCIDRSDRKGATPLMLAAQGASHSTACPRSTSLVPPKPRPRSSSNPPEDTLSAGTLLTHGASVSTTDTTGNTALHYASAWGNLKTFRVLMLAGASPLAVNDAGYTPVDYALTSQAAAYCRTVVSDMRQPKFDADDPPQPHYLQERSQSPQSPRPHHLEPRVSEDDSSSPAASEPHSPPGSRMRKDSGKAGLGLSRAGIGPGPSRLVIQDDQPLSDDEVPLTARRVNSASQNGGSVNGGLDWGR